MPDIVLPSSTPHGSASVLGGLLTSRAPAVQLTRVVAASLFVALCAHVSVPLPFTPVPLTFGNFGVVLVGLALGPEFAFAALLLYLAEGAAGAPFFNPGGPGGIAQLFGPTGGFLIAYPFAAALTGLLLRRVRQAGASAFGSAFLACTVATLLVLAVGAVWLGVLLHLSPRSTFLLATAPFLPGEIVKVLAAAGLYQTSFSLRKSSL